MQVTAVLYWILIFYVVIINIVAFLAMWWDKRKASQREWRVAKVTLHILGFIGGALGIIGECLGFAIKPRRNIFKPLQYLRLLYL